MKFKFDSISLSVLALGICAGCASDPKVATNGEKPVNCEREYRVGSNIPSRDCRAAMSEDERQRMIQQTRDSTRTVPNKPGAGG